MGDSERVVRRVSNVSSDSAPPVQAGPPLRLTAGEKHPAISVAIGLVMASASVTRCFVPIVPESMVHSGAASASPAPTSPRFVAQLSPDIEDGHLVLLDSDTPGSSNAPTSRGLLSSPPGGYSTPRGLDTRAWAPHSSTRSERRSPGPAQHSRRGSHPPHFAQVRPVVRVSSNAWALCAKASVADSLASQCAVFS